MSRLNRPAGFTLLEVIAVLAIMAILAATIAPGLVREIDRANADAETGNLREIATALRNYTMRERRIPGPNPADWAAALAGEMTLAENDLAVNRRGFRRRLVFDPLFMSSTPAAFSGYQQTAGLSARPFSPRALLVSSLRSDAPAIPNIPAEFDRVWNEEPGARIVPDEFTKVERIQFRDLFDRVLIVNQRDEMPAYALDGAAPSPVPAATAGSDGMISLYAIRGSELRLFASPFPTGALQTALLVDADLSRRYQTDGFDWTWSEP